MLAFVGATVGGLAGSAYCVGRSIDSDLRFLEPRRAPTFDEATIAYPIEYALRSHESNDVIFLGDSTCRFGVDPIQFERLSGLRAYNLGSVGGFLGPPGILLPAKAYLLRHPRPQIIVLCMTPFEFQVGTQQLNRMSIAMPKRYLANYGPEVPGVVPWQESLAYFTKRGSVAAWQAVRGLVKGADPDVRDLPITSGNETYRTFHRSLDESRGHWVPPQPHGKKSEGARDDPSWPGKPKVDPEWDSAVRDLADTCREHGVPLLIRLTPISSTLSKAKDFKPIETWARELQRSYRDVTVADRAILWYAPELHWDADHLNAQGAAAFTSLVAKQVRAALVSGTRPSNQ